jgi:hypothetical protein
MAKKQPPSNKPAASNAATVSVRATQPHRYHGTEYDVGDAYDVDTVNLGAVLGRGYAVRTDAVGGAGTRRTAQAHQEDAAPARGAAKTARAAKATRPTGARTAKRGRGR